MKKISGNESNLPLHGMSKIIRERGPTSVGCVCVTPDRCVVRACPHLFRRAQSEASQRKPRARFTAPGLDEAKVLSGLE